MTGRIAGGTIAHMELMEVDDAGHRLYLGALESPHGDGYTAALAVQRLDAPSGAEALFRDDRLACGHRFATADDALAYALRRGRAWLRTCVAPVTAAAAQGGVPAEGTRPGAASEPA